MSRIEYNSTKIAEFEKAINQSKVTVQEIRDTVKDCSKKTIGMQEKKLEAALYTKEMTAFRESLQTLSFALKDNFS